MDPESQSVNSRQAPEDPNTRPPKKGYNFTQKNANISIFDTLVNLLVIASSKTNEIFLNTEASQNRIREKCFSSITNQLKPVPSARIRDYKNQWKEYCTRGC